MNREKIVKDIINYLKFYKEYNNYSFNSDEMEESNSSIVLTHPEAAQFKNLKEEIISQPVLKSEERILSKNVSDDRILPLIQEDWMESKTLDSFAESIKDCPKCILLAKTRKQVVFGTGNPNADIVVVGEAPGSDEDQQGKPFVGRAGKLLTEILLSINFRREDIFICNILKCRPPENRNPLPLEIANCEPYLFKQLEMIKPKLILALGTFASQTLLQTKEPLGRLRGKFHTFKGIKMIVTYHPAALLRNPNWKRPTWEDVQLFRKEYDRLVST